MPVIPSAGNLAPFLEDSEEALLVLGETGAAIADKLFFNKNARRLPDARRDTARKTRR